jgi:hypothetical protein
MSEMKKTLFIVLIASSCLLSCKAVMKGAARYWTKKQIKEFITNCETHASKLMSTEKAVQYCDCAVNVVSEKYQNYEDVKSAGIMEVLKIAKDCKQ